MIHRSIITPFILRAIFLSTVNWRWLWAECMNGRTANRSNLSEMTTPFAQLTYLNQPLLRDLGGHQIGWKLISHLFIHGGWLKEKKIVTLEPPCYQKLVQTPPFTFASTCLQLYQAAPYHHEPGCILHWTELDIFTYTKIHMYIYTHTNIYTCTHAHMYTRTHEHMYTYTHIRINIYR